MSGLRVGGLFAGYGGLELAVSSVFPDAQPVWFSEFAKAPSRILAHHWRGVPNLGDITAIDWSTVEPVDILTGGSPCQDLSTAGKRSGMTGGTRSNLWVCMREAVAVLHPRLVIWENVRGALSARAASEVEREPGRLGNGKRRPALRALGRVLGDLASLRYDTVRVGLRAADVGAPHGRFRVFVLAWPSEDPAALSWPSEDPAALSWPSEDPAALLPTPAVNDMGRAYTPEAWDEWTARMKAEHGNGNGHGASLSIEALRLLPTPTVSDGNGPGDHGDGGRDLRPEVALLPTPTAKDSASSGGAVGSSNVTLTDAVVRYPERWGRYAAAVARWEALTRPAPDPTEPTGKHGAHRLSPRFSEWMMGLPAGWVTDVDISRNDQLEALGNGVVPQQGAEGITWCLGVAAGAVAA